MLRINDVEVVPSEHYNVDTSIAAYREYAKNIKNPNGYVEWCIQMGLVVLAPKVVIPVATGKRKPRASLTEA